MYILVANVLFLAAIGLGAAEASTEPLVVFVQEGRARVLGLTGPHLALYSDGFLIRRRLGTAERPESGFQAANLSESEMEQLLASLNLEALYDLDDHYRLTSATDQSTYTVHWWQDGKRHTVSVYGSLNASFARNDREACPTAFLHVVDAISGLQLETEPWLPEQIEIALSSVGGVGRDAIQWPSAWPAPSQASTSGSWVTLVPASEWPLVQELTRPGTVVGWEGRQWRLLRRFPFPKEEAW